MTQAEYNKRFGIFVGGLVALMFVFAFLIGNDAKPTKAVEQSKPVVTGRIATQDDIGAIIISKRNALGCPSRDDALLLLANEAEDHSREVAGLKRHASAREMAFGTVLRGGDGVGLLQCFHLDGAALPCLWVRTSNTARLTN